VLIDIGCDADSLDVTLVDPHGHRDPAPPGTPIIRGCDRVFGHRFRDQFPILGPMESATSIELMVRPRGAYRLIVAARSDARVPVHVQRLNEGCSAGDTAFVAKGTARTWRLGLTRPGASPCSVRLARSPAATPAKGMRDEGS
jgi:hypothetical protein